MIRRSHAFLFVLGCLVIAVVLMFSGFFTVNILKMNGSQATLSVIIFVGAMAIGVVWKLVLDAQNATGNITWAELLVGGLIVGLLFSVVGVNIGWKVAFDNTVKYNEWWNGWELGTKKQPNTCTENGSCYPMYDCDSYTVSVSDYDSKGNYTGSHTETRWNSCPYVSVQYTFTVHTSLGDYNMGNLCFPDNPNANRFQATRFIPSQFDEAEYFKPIPQNILNSVCIGTPPLWAAAKARVDSGHPGPVTQRNSYDNYILASDTTIFKQYSSQIEAYKKAGVLPDLRRDVRDFYQADKVYFVGFKPADPAVWQKAHSYLNAALGTELQGDFHLVIVQNGYVSANPDAYAIALKAYWQNPEVFGKDALSKNVILVVLGTTDGSTVSWSRASTGMPIGNESMLTAIQNHMAGTSMTPEAVIGWVDGQFYQKVKSDGTTKLAVKGVGDTGAQRRIFWGMDDKTTEFARVSMSAKDPKDNGTGFNYLKDQIKPDFGQQLTIVLVFLFLSVVLWGVEAFFVGDLRY